MDNTDPFEDKLRAFLEDLQIIDKEEDDNCECLLCFLVSIDPLWTYVQLIGEA